MVNSPNGSVNADGFAQIGSAALDPDNHRLFVSDYGNNRILVFPLNADNSISTTTPNHVLGSCSMTVAGSGAATASTFGGNMANINYDRANQRLFVSDSNHNRVLAFDASPSSMSDCESALFVIGQSDFVSGGSAVTQNGLSSPDNVDYDPANGRLFVSDQANNRVMAFSVPANATSSINGENALFELGQADFTSNAPLTTQSGMNTTLGISFDPVNSRLFVSDLYRVMAFNVPANATSSINGENALFELGQADFTGTAYAATQNRFAGGPDDNVYDAANQRLFVSDWESSRILVFNVPSDATSGINGENAENLIGQDSWTATVSGTGQDVFGNIESPHAYDPVHNRLFSYECYQYRVLEFDMIHITTGSLPSGAVGSPYSQTISVENAQGGSRTYAVSSGFLPSGLSLDPSTGALSGTPTSATTTAFTIEANDNFSTGFFFDRETYTVTIAPSAPPSNAPESVSAPSGGRGGGIVSRVRNLISLGNEAAAYALMREWPKLFPAATPVASSSVSSVLFRKNLKIGSAGGDVAALQKYLNAHGFAVKETSYFGALTKAALVRFQKAKGISPATGYFGPLTRAYMNAH